MTRSLEIWRGKTDDEKVPLRVRVRIFEREGGRCWITGRKITPADKWELDHRIALVNGGTHSEDNLFPALAHAHRAKTSEDVKLKSKIARQRAKHLGVWESSSRKIAAHVDPWGKQRRKAAQDGSGTREGSKRAAHGRPNTNTSPVEKAPQ